MQPRVAKGVIHALPWALGGTRPRIVEPTAVLAESQCTLAQQVVHFAEVVRFENVARPATVDQHAPPAVGGSVGKRTK